MDVLKALRELYLEKSRLDRLIAICESKIKEQDRRLSRSKRGRKSMSAEERQIVSERMRTYWAKRRTGKGGETGAAGDAPGRRADDVSRSGAELPEVEQSARAATSS
jgi:hypothetical protein